MRPSHGNWPILLIAAGFTAWGVIFLLLYGAQAIGCRLSWDRIELVGDLSIQRFIQIALFLSALVAMALIWRRLRRETTNRKWNTTASMFLVRVSSYAAQAALGAVAFCFAGVFWLLAC